VARSFTRFTVGSAVATAASQLAFLLLFGILGASAAVSGAVAFAVGAVPNFVISRCWTWQRTGRVGVRSELVPYLAVITVNGLLATGGAVGIDRLLGSTITDHAARTVVLATAFGAGYVLLFVLKFALLDRLVFAAPAAAEADSAKDTPARRTERSRHQVPTSTRA
jgi:putative flippase GtrA